ncbi:MAG TPA: amidase [Bryobacteraceae bacterium]|jgi:aspartyl-tRNA(Asn)/glutamyl-tRNA(Gln) amidotransferase subunit A|nr:amidase [Bryobacteraceae bacterium]
MKISELARALRAREINCVELVQRTLHEIEARDSYRSFITKTPDLALAEAAERDKELSRGRDRGPLHGIPIAHKDLFYTKGIRTTAGSLVFRDFVPDDDADAVTLLREAGAVSLGKTNLHELAYGITSKNPHYGFVLNPRDPARIAGGSSGGSATLVAAGLLPFATGTDTGGSIRVPAAFCGITGIKPTFDLVSRRGVLPLSFSLDHVGPLGSCVEDCALALDALAEGEFNLPAFPHLRGIRIGVPKNFYFDRLNDEVATAVNCAISSMQKLGAGVDEVTVPDPPKANAAARIVQLSETAALYADNTDSKEFSPETWELLQQGRLIAGHDYVNAQRMRTVFRRQWDDLWNTIDVLALPTTPTVAPRLEEKKLTIAGTEEDVRLATTRLVRAFNYTGDPALSMPCGTDSLGLPVGLQLVAAPYSDARLLRIAKTLEAELGLNL